MPPAGHKTGKKTAAAKPQKKKNAGEAAKPIQSIESAVSPPSAQLQAVCDYMKRNRMMTKFDQLPPGSDFIFANASSDGPGRVHGRKLFLGGCKNPEYQLWGYLIPSTKAAAGQVILYKDHFDENDGKFVKDPILGNDFKNLQFMYPFAVIANKSSASARSELGVLIQYYFLETRELEEVWINGGKSPMKTLKVIVNTIAKTYEQYPGGVAAIPDTYGPNNIPEHPHPTMDPVEEDDDDDDTDEELTPQNPFKRPSAPRGLVHGRENEKQASAEPQTPMLNLVDAMSRNSITPVPEQPEKPEQTEKTNKRKRDGLVDEDQSAYEDEDETTRFEAARQSYLAHLKKLEDTRREVAETQRLDREKFEEAQRIEKEKLERRERKVNRRLMEYEEEMNKLLAMEKAKLDGFLENKDIDGIKSLLGLKG